MGIKDNKILFISIQIIVALIIILILYIITLLVLNTDSLIIYNNKRVKQNEKTDIIKGRTGIMKLSGRKYNTVNPYSENFKKIARSLNNKGGAQFTYQFWMKIDDTDDDNYKDVIILLRGDNTKYNKGIYDPITKDRIILKNDEPEYMIKNPLIKFGKSYKNLIIEFNTNKDPSIKMEVNVEGENRKNILSLTPLNWYLITYVLEDNFAYATGTENGINITLYINDFPYQVLSASTNVLLKNNYLRQNEGDLYLFPNVTKATDFMELADIKYYNYALSQKEISSDFNKGPSKFIMKDDDIVNNKNKPTFISAYNKLDIYNY